MRAMLPDCHNARSLVFIPAGYSVLATAAASHWHNLRVASGPAITGALCCSAPMLRCDGVHPAPATVPMQGAAQRNHRLNLKSGSLWSVGHPAVNVPLPSSVTPRPKLRPAHHITVTAASAPGAAQQRPASLKAADAQRAAQLKRQLTELAGGRNGTDRDEAQRQDIAAVIEKLEALNLAEQPVTVDLTGTEWRLVYSSSMAASAGKIGPFVGRVWQEFPADQRSQYINWVSFAGGILKAKLLADYGRAPGRDDRLNVTFVNTIYMLGPLHFKMDMSNGGWWRLTYTDSDCRILYANTGNVFVLAR